MITKIDIEKFGLFKNYDWGKTVGKQELFRRVNIIYGKNYSGKTTLSRVLSCIENKELHKNYLDAKFNVVFSNDKSVSHANVFKEFTDYKIRVYNTDFVRKHLSWLHNDDGSITPFTILGAANVEMESKIKDIDRQLGGVEAGKESGLLYRLRQSEQTYLRKKSAYETEQKAIKDLLAEQAKKIKEYDMPVIAAATYNITKIKKDIPDAQKQGELSAEAIAARERFLREEPKNAIERLREIKPRFDAYYAQARALLQKQIEPSRPIAELINNSLLQEWVRQGIDYHKGKMETCGFCGNPIDKSLWDKLSAHFSKESEELRTELKSEINRLESAKKNLENFFSLSMEQFYAVFAPRFEAVQKQWNAAIKTYSQNIDALIFELGDREKDIFKARDLPNIPDVSRDVLDAILNANKLIDEHNKKRGALSKEQDSARLELRYSEIAKFLNRIKYDARIAGINHLNAETEAAEAAFEALNTRVEALNDEKRTLEAQAKDESRGAELVNRHLQRYFGHSDLRMVAVGNAPNIRFKIVRNNMDANNLSEGECSIISFCYFVAKMEDELNNNVDNKKLIIYVDDPISNLDDSHIFFMYNLIDNVIAKNEKYGQLFISTHNLEFLKYIKGLTIPGDGRKASSVNHFIVEKKKIGNEYKCELKAMSPYLRDYATEYNFLFKEIYDVAKPSENGG